ncbi:ABC transporter permease [Anaerosporobacter faecicola]|uniref:ABC transporter permease n=1 Tax=Anaerosporobacter faecicola TaxID=2718714 RepID=UPI00143A00FF|nr:ABC transporter permease [Anaerosporobacter faecicola]
MFTFFGNLFTSIYFQKENILIQGLIFAILALGVYITYKILDFPDLSVDGTFPLGAAVTAVLITNGVNPYLTLPVAFLCGAFAGVLTGIIHVKLRVRDLLAGIIMSTALYTVNLRIAGKANVPFFSKDTIFTLGPIGKLFEGNQIVYGKIILVIIIVVVIKILLDLYLKTRSGYLLRATGDNSTLVTSLGKDKGLVKILGLSIANGLAALAGCIYAQDQAYSDVSMGTGMVMLGLASVIIGTSVFKAIKCMKSTTAVIIGSVVYKLCIALAIAAGLNANDLKFIYSALFLVILVSTRERKKKVKRNA